MAKYECHLIRDFDKRLDRLEQGILGGSISTSFQDGSDYSTGNLCCAVMVYEWYSYSGGNRVSLTLTLVGEGEAIFLSAITSEGSQTVFFKINTIGEESFLNALVELVEVFQIEERWDK